MSYYQFSGPLQGGFGPDDDDMRRRRKHYRDAGAPYSGGITRLQEKAPIYDVQVKEPKWGAQPDPPAAGVPQAPRVSAAVDLGQGPVQTALDTGREKQLAAQYFDDPPALAVPSGGLSKKSGIGEMPHFAPSRRPYDPSEIVWRRQPEEEETGAVAAPPQPPGRPGKDDDMDDDPQPPSVPRPTGPTVPAARPTPRIAQPPSLPSARPLAIPKKTPELISEDPIGRAVPVRAGVDPRKAGARALRKSIKRKRGDDPDFARPSPGAPAPPPPPFKKDEQPSDAPTQPAKRRKKVSFGKTRWREFHKGRAIQPWKPSERDIRLGYQQLGQGQGREMARREHQITIDKLHKQNRDLIADAGRMTQQGGQLAQEYLAQQAQGRKLLHEREGMMESGRRLEKEVREGTRRAGKLVQERSQMVEQGRKLQEQVRAGQEERGRMMQSGKRLEEEVRSGTRRAGELVQEHSEYKQETEEQIRKLQQGMGSEGLARQTAERRLESVIKTGDALEEVLNRQIRRLKEGMGSEGIAKEKAQEQYQKLLAQGNSIIQNLEKKIDDGNVSAAAAKKEIDALNRALSKLRAVPKAPVQDKSEINALKGELAGLKSALKGLGRERRGGGGQPIVVQGGAGGGGASSSAGGSSASSGGGGSAPARAPDLSGMVAAVKQMAAAKGEAGKKAAKGGTKGITRARRTYTDKRKTKLAEMRALKSKRIREFNTKTKKMNKADRNKARREFKKKVESQFKEMQSRFPTARGLKSVGVIRELIRKIDAIKTAR